MAKTPKLGGELPAYKTQGRVPRQQGFPDKPKAPRKMVGPPAYLTSKTVVRSPKVSLGTPGTKNYVQRTRDGYTLGGTTVKEGTMLMRRPAKQTVSRKRPLGPTR